MNLKNKFFLSTLLIICISLFSGCIINVDSDYIPSGNAVEDFKKCFQNKIWVNDTASPVQNSNNKIYSLDYISIKNNYFIQLVRYNERPGFPSDSSTSESSIEIIYKYSKVENYNFKNNYFKVTLEPYKVYLLHPEKRFDITSQFHVDSQNLIFDMSYAFNSINKCIQITDNSNFRRTYNMKKN